MTARSGYGRGVTRTVRIGLFVLLLVLALSWQSVSAAWGDRAADSVYGQADYTSREANRGSTAADNTLSDPRGVSVDHSGGRFFIADRGNHRIQSWPHGNWFSIGEDADLSITSDGQGPLTLYPMSTATDSGGILYIADYNNRVLVCPPPYSSCSHVIGQHNFFSNLDNQGGSPDNDTLSGPRSVAIDSSGHLFVADYLNNRVLRYTLPITVDGQAADLVLGQAGFKSSEINRGHGEAVATADGLYQPQGVAVDSAGNVYVADTFNSRVLRFDAPLSNGQAASLVLGQANFSGRAANRGLGSPTAQTLNMPNAVAVDPNNRLYVADNMNTRVLGFELYGLSNGGAAKIVIGQPDFGPPKYDPMAPPSDVSLAYPSGLALDDAMNLYVADTSNNRALRYDSPWVFIQELPMIRK